MIEYTKPSLVNAILKELPDDSPYHDMTHEEIQSYWFLSKRGDGLQLTLDGDAAFRDANIEYYERPLEWPKVSSGTLKIMPDIIKTKVELSRKITCPYYIFEECKIVEEGNKKVEQFYHSIRLYDDSLTVWIDLRGGIEKYLKSID